MEWSPVVLLAPALAGCSLIYNPNNLPAPRMVDAAVVDANACALTLSSIAPAIIKEGQGDSGSPPALLVIQGDNIVSTNLKVDLESQDGSIVHLAPITDAVASANNAYAAFTVTAHVDPALTTDVALKVTVTQDAPQDGSCMGKAMGQMSGKLTLSGLPELTTLTTTLLPEYSMVALSNVTFPSSVNPVAIKAVSSIMLGTVAANASGATAGPGAFSAGGMPGPGAGGGGMPAPAVGFGGGGGGGGFAVAGMGGANGAGPGGTPGPSSGQDQILSIGGNLASAGGAGGSGLAVLGGTILLGGGGGGGGGVVVLTAGGDITTGAISANGGPGTSPNGGSILGGGGGGGGGAGGTVVVRTTAGVLKTGVIHVTGGPPGSPGGGTGSVGRVRWDAPASPVLMSPDRPAHRGPTFKDATRVVTSPGQSFTLVGTSGDEFDVYMIDSAGTLHAGEHASFNGAGIAAITPSLSDGYNALCVKLAGGMQSEPVANACIDVAFLP